MKPKEKLFPFNCVEKGSRIILYGLGRLGKTYLHQINQLEWCEIVYLMDRHALQREWNYKLLDMDGIGDIQLSEYDYIVIAIRDFQIVQQVSEDLTARGVPKERIVSTALPESVDDIATCDDSPLQILLYLEGGVGDGVTDLAIYKRLIDIVPNAIIDVYGEPFIHFLYKSKTNVRYVYDYNKTIICQENYDLVLKGTWWLVVQHRHMGRLRQLAPELAKLVELTEKDVAKNDSIGSRVKQAQILEKDKFWLMSHGGAWGLYPSMIHVDFDSNFATEFRKLNLKNYITINCGADMRYVDDGRQPTKIWPKEYFERFIHLFYKMYPEFEVIQLGAVNQERIIGANRHFLGMPFELVTYVLKKSFLHIDDESGLVHLATAIGTKCICIFGPTRPDVFGYETNINICTDACAGCAYNVADWNAQCLRGMERPACMYSITPEIVIEQVERYFNSL